MVNLYYQPRAYRFGTVLQDLINDTRWSVVEIGVAWIRRSGLQYLRSPLIEFLNRGGLLRISVGIDIDNTSREGLEALLELRPYGSAELYVYHNESSSTFHPKLYLFSNKTEAKLLVGSNNLTESGLYLNVEAALEIEATVNDEVISSARATLSAWRDVSDRLALPLTDDLLTDLVRLGYVFPENSLRHRARRQFADSSDTGSKVRTPLFGRQVVTPPVFQLAPKSTAKPSLPLPQVETERSRRPEQPGGYQSDVIESEVGEVAASHASNQNIGRVLIMRVRKAHTQNRPTQVQIPFALYEDPFFNGVMEIISAHDNVRHGFIRASARGGRRNTIKLEVPEIRTFVDPVLRLEHTAQGVIYQAYDANAVLGQPLMASLLRGLEMNPPQTRLTVPGNRDKATMWRFI